MKSFNRSVILFLLLWLSFSACQSDRSKPAPSQKQDTARVNEMPPSRPCGDRVTDLLTSTDRFKQLTKGLNEAIQKNGGSSYGIMLEGSPDPIRDQANERSSTYNLSLHESYPDRITVIARFSFDPVKKQLFERDVIEDTLIPISFDSKLLLNSPCFKN